MNKPTRIWIYTTIISILLFTIFSFIKPAIYYWWENEWEDGKIIINNFLNDLNPQNKLALNAKALSQNIYNEKILHSSYKIVFSWSNATTNILTKKYKNFAYINAFIPIKIEDTCFIFEADALVLDNEIWGKITKYRKISPESTTKCEENCKVYFTEKWLLETSQGYSCNTSPIQNQ